MDAHIAVALEMQRSTMIRSWEQMCHQQGEMDRITTWMRSRFPESSAPWVHSKRGHKVQVAGDGLLISKCTPVFAYYVLWNRTIGSTCFSSFPVHINSNLSQIFLNLADRELTPFSTIIDCNKHPNNTIIEDINGKLWSTSANGTCFLEKANTSSPLHPKYKFPIIRGFNAKLAREQEVSLPRHSMLQIITASHTTLNQLNHFSITEGGGDFCHGLGSIIGKAISAVTTGGSSLLRAAGACLKESFEGLGDFSGKIALRRNHWDINYK